MLARLERFAPLTGVAFFVLFAVLFFTPETPTSDKPAAEMVAFWADHKTQQFWVSATAALAAVMLVWFGGSLRRAILSAEKRDGRLATLTFAGLVIAAIGLLIVVGFSFAAVETVNKVPAEVTQTLTILSNEVFFPVLAGLLIFYVASFLSILRFRVLPVWLGWVSLVFAVLVLTPFGWIGFIGVSLWVGVAGIVLFLRQSPAAAQEP